MADSFADLLRDFRLASGLTQDELASRAGLSPRTLSDLERGIHRAPFRHTVGLLAQALLLSPQQAAVLEASITRARRSRGRQRPSQSAIVPDLPVPETPILGRDSELQLCLSLLEHRETRLLTIAGAGGMGKTRLALEIGRIAGIGGGRLVVFVALELGLEASKVLRQIAVALAIEADDENALMNLIALRLRTERTLIILDGLEQAIGVRLQLIELLERLPALQFIVTRRQPVGLRGEHVVVVGPLPLASGRDGEDPPASDAVRLFMASTEAAGVVLPASGEVISMVARIVDELGDIPLAIELAATQAALDGPEAVLAALDAISRRQGSNAGNDVYDALSRAIALAQRRLSAQQLRLLRFCALFPGEWSAAHISALQRSTGSNWATLPNLNALVRRRLVVRTSGSNASARYAMANVIRQAMFAELQRLGEQDEANDAFATMMAAVVRELSQPGENPINDTDPLDFEERNLALALRRFKDSGREDEALQALWTVRYWLMRAPRPPVDECLEEYREAASHLAGERRIQVDALLTTVCIARGRYEEGATLLRACVAEAHALGADELAMEAVEMTAWSPVLDNELETLVDSRVEVARRLGDNLRLGHLLTSRARRRLREQDYASVEADCREALSLEQWLLPQADPRIVLGVCYVYEQKMAEAREIFQRLLASQGPRGALASFVFATMGTISQQLLQERRAAIEYRDGLRFAPEGSSIQPVGLCLEGAAWIASRQQQWLDAARLLGAASMISPPSDVQTTLQLAAKTADLIRPEIPTEYESAFRSGAALSMERAISLAILYLDSIASIDTSRN